MAYEFLHNFFKLHPCRCGEKMDERAVFSFGACREPLPVPDPNLTSAYVVLKCIHCGNMQYLGLGVEPGAFFRCLEEETGLRPTFAAADPHSFTMPYWVTKAYDDVGCAGCGGPFTECDVLGVEMCVQDVAPAAAIEFFVSMKCRSCGIHQSLPALALPSEFAGDVERLVHLLRMRRGGRGELPPQTKITRSDADEISHPRRLPIRPRREIMWPSMRYRQPRFPITDFEHQKFLKMLGKLDWRRSSKKFQEWLKRMRAHEVIEDPPSEGGKPPAPEDPPKDEDLPF
jgi:hypothetical protein